MRIREVRDVRDGKFWVRFLFEEFADDEVFLLSRYGPLMLSIPPVGFQSNIIGTGQGPVRIKLEDLASVSFWFANNENAKKFSDEVISMIRNEFESFVATTVDFVGSTLFEVRVGEEIKRINDGAKKALDRNSEEYKEIIRRNKEAFEKLSKL